MIKTKRGRFAMKTRLLPLVSLLFPFLAEAATLNTIDSVALPGDKVEIKLTFDGAPPDPLGYTIENPARIALDLNGVNNGMKSKYHTIGTGNARSLTVMEVKDKTRVIVNLAHLAGYKTRRENNSLIVTIGEDALKPMAVAATNAAPATNGKAAAGSSPVSRTSASNSIKDLDFRRGESGEGQVMIGLSSPNAPVDMREEGGKIVVRFSGVSLPPQLSRKLDVVDFATPVSAVTAVNEGGNAVITINPKGDYEYLAYQTDNLFTVAVKPISAADLEKKRKDAFNYTGEKLSLNFQDIEVRSVLQLIADFTELNLVASDSVEGRITLRLQNVPWDQALDLVLKTKGLDKRKVGNVILVAPASEIAEREKLELETTKQVEELAPLRTEYLQVNYAKASDLAELITSDNGFLTDRGTATVDARTNTILVQDTSAKLEEIRQLLKQLDVPVKQVLIESRVVVARQSVGEELGVQWGQFREDVRPNGGGTWYTAPRNDMIRQMYNNDVSTTKTAVTGDTLSVDLASPSSNAASFAIGYLKDGTLIDMELSALESTGNVNIIATPKLLTADQQKARIESGREIPYQEASSSGATTISFKKAVLALEVTPHITPDGRIIMDLQINQDSVGDNVVIASSTGGSSTSVPSIDTNKIQTSVLVDDGETVVLGGVFKNETTDTVNKVPFLGDLPVLGRLFRSNSKTELKQELLIFITPKVVHNVIAQQ